MQAAIQIFRRATRRPTTLAALALTAGFAVLAPTHAQVQNGSFETGTFVDNGAGAASLGVGSTAITGWTTTNAELAWIVNGDAYGIATPQGGPLFTRRASLYKAGLS